MPDSGLKPAWIRTRARRLSALLEEALEDVLKKQQPADRFLKRIFRQDRRIGGRDRRLYGDLIFAVFRWYGPLHRHLSGPPLLLAGAAAAENLNVPEVAVFLENAGMDRVRQEEFFAPGTPMERLNAFLRLAGKPADAALRDTLPQWIFPLLDFPADEEFCAMEQTRSPLWIRVRDRSLPETAGLFRSHGLTPEPHPRLTNALRIDDAGVNLNELGASARGRFEVQDLASQCIGLACAPQDGQCWWDACAGGGGKSLHLAALMHGKGTITASDVRTNKLEEVRRRAKLASFSNIRTREWDGGPRLPVGENSCDGVLVDAPCSSSGRWRRNPESRWQLTGERAAELASVQKKLLGSASRAVKPGGVLLYATCSILNIENRLNVEYFLAMHPEFALEEFPHPLTGETVPGQVQILPHSGNCDASFIARFRKRK